MKFIRTNTEEVLLVKEKMVQKQARVPYLIFQAFQNTGLVRHCFSTRMGGVSKGIYASMNLSFARGDEHADVTENFRRIAAIMDADIEDFVSTDQTHTVNIRKVGRADKGNGITKEKAFFDVDGLITDEPAVVLSTFYADCVPLYFLDPVKKAIGLAHAGWRGTVNQMGSRTIEAMSRAYGSRPQDLICGIGPSICQSCYEVGSEVAEAFQKAFYRHEQEILLEKKQGKYQLDLWRANELVLLSAGVKKDNIHTTNICTCCNDKLLFSHRASKGKRGNLGAFLSLKG